MSVQLQPLEGSVSQENLRGEVKNQVLICPLKGFLHQKLYKAAPIDFKTAGTETRFSDIMIPPLFLGFLEGSCVFDPPNDPRYVLMCAAPALFEQHTDKQHSNSSYSFIF